MRKIILFIASSLDNYIARKNHTVDWLFSEGDFGFNEFYKTVDTLLMGRKTYEVSLKLSPKENPFKDKVVYILSRNKNYKTKYNENVVSNDHLRFTEELLNKSGKNVWLVGGGEITKSFMQNNFLDEIVLSIHPIILGEGIQLFISHKNETNLKLIESKSFNNGLVQLKYEIKKN